MAVGSATTEMRQTKPLFLLCRTGPYGAATLGLGSTSAQQPVMDEGTPHQLDRERSWFISDDERFYREFTEYLRRDGGIVDRPVMESFAKHHGGKNFLAQLSSLCRVSRQGLVPLPLPWDWLERSVPENYRKKALEEYGRLLEFLLELLRVRGPLHMSPPELEFRRRHLGTIEVEVWEREQARRAEG